MLRLIGLIVVVLLVLSLAHGERTGNANDRLSARADTLVDRVTGRLADGVRSLGDAVFGPAEPGAYQPDSLRALSRNLEGLSRSADATSRRALAQVVLRSCPTLGLVCQPAPGGLLDDPNGLPRRRPPADDQR